jgi:fido (protein-threonine AMPylation protein)
MWKLIEDLPGDLTSLSDGELAPLLRYWEDLRADLDQTGQLVTFRSQLSREWAIETGQIEGVYDVDRGVTATLIERGISADLIPHVNGQKPPELIAAIIRDHQEVLEGLFQFVKGERRLSKSYINEIHAALLRNQTTTTVVDQFNRVFEVELLKGRYKLHPNNPTGRDGIVHLYCPPEHVESEMDRLLAMHAEHFSNEVPVEVEAAWLHHRFTQIHPYQDGNGRVARAIGSLVFLKVGWFPIVVAREDRVRYIEALEVADDGDLRLLVGFFVDAQKRALFKATKIAADVVPAQTVDEAIASAKRVLTTTPRSLDPTTWLQSKETADHLLAIAVARLQEIKFALDEEIRNMRPDFTFKASDMAFAISAPGLYDKVSTLSLTHNPSNEERTIVIQARGIGPKFRGLIGVETSFWNAVKPAPIWVTEPPFQINYAESPDNAERRFRPWLERSLTQALTLWRQSL